MVARYMARRNPLRDDAYRDHIRSEPCVVAVSLGTFEECQYAVQACHVHHQGMGGKDVPDHGNLWPGCLKHHAESHRGVKTFQRKYNLDLCDIALKMEERYESGYVA